MMSSRRADRTRLGSRHAGTTVFCGLHSQLATFVSASSASVTVNVSGSEPLVSYDDSHLLFLSPSSASVTVNVSVSAPIVLYHDHLLFVSLSFASVTLLVPYHHLITIKSLFRVRAFYGCYCHCVHFVAFSFALKTSVWFSVNLVV